MLQVNAITTQKNPEAYKKLMDAATRLTKKGVVAGFPKGKLNTPHYEIGKGKKGPSIIDVALRNNFGMGVPRRDFMTPATKRWKKFFQESLDSIQRELLQDKIDEDKFLNAMGQKGADIISQEIIALDTPPNAPTTEKKKGSSNPLVDSGDMARATTWQIRRGKDK